MCQKVLWCYIFVLTLLDISVNTKLTAQGESHGVTIHESLVERITFQEWSKESGVGGLDGFEGDTENVEGIILEPRTLKFGRSALAVPHSRTITLTNTANTTLHLASVAGTTPDFHASFFESKTLPPQGNTTFSVVYLGRQEGPVHAHLYIHTSLGVHKYHVSAVGVASDYGVWPLLDVRVPLNATVEPELRLYNPTDATVQVREIYSTGAWLRLRLPGGGARAHRDLWVVPPRSFRTLALLRLAPHAAPHAALHQPLVAYVRIKADLPGGGLVVAVEARAVPAGEHTRPLHLRLGVRGSGDRAPSLALAAANSAEAPATLEGGVRGAACWRAGPPPPSPCAAPAPSLDPHRHNGAATAGVTLTLDQISLVPHQAFTHVASLALNYSEMWSEAGVTDATTDELWCVGCVRLGRAAVPFSVHLLPGTLSFTPDHLDIVTATEEALREHEIRALNKFKHTLRIDALHLPPEAADHFHLVEHTPLTLGAGESATLLRLRLRAPPPVAFSLSADLTVHTNLSSYTLPVRVYSGRLIFEWEWVNGTVEVLELGAVGTSWTRRVGVRLRNLAPVAVCVRALEAALPGAAATLALDPAAVRCVPPGGAQRAWLTVVAPAREASLRGRATVHTAHAATVTALSLRVRAGHVRAHDLRLPPAAPYAGSSAELEVESSMSARMRVTAVEVAPPADPHPALIFDWQGKGYGELSAGLQRVARVTFAPERRCRPRCYTGLDLASDEGAAWRRRGSRGDAAALREDAAEVRVRLAQYDALSAEENFALHVHTTEVLQIAAGGAVTLTWPRLASPPARAPLAAVGRAVALRVSLVNPAQVPLVLHALLAPAAASAQDIDLPPSAGGERQYCVREKCAWSRDAFALTGWSSEGEGEGGAAWPWDDGEVAAEVPALVLAPRASVTLALAFTPPDAGAFTTYLYLRNNLTILEGVQLYGEGVYPTFDIGGKRPNSTLPFLFEVMDCWWGGGSGAAGGPGAGGGAGLARRLVARNAGAVPVQLAQWRLARGGCEARGFRLAPCSPLVLPPNASDTLYLSFSPDYTLSRVTALLQLHTDMGPAEYLLMATVPAKVLARCSAIAPRPPWEGLLRSAGTVLAFAAFVLVLTVAVLDAERLLRRARASRMPAPAAAPAALDLRGLADAAAPAVAVPRPAPAGRRRPPAPRRPLDPRAERRAFERWRAEMLRQGDEGSSRSSEDADADPDGNGDAEDAPLTPPAIHFDDNKPHGDGEEEEDDDDDDDDDEEEEEVGTAVVEEDGGFTGTGSDASTPVEDREDVDESYGADGEPELRDDSPAVGLVPTVKPIVRALVRTPPADGGRPSRSRRVLRASPRDFGDTPRRTERARLADVGDRRTTPARHHARKERPPKRRGDRTQPTPPPRSPAPPPGSEAGARSWSSVVATGGAGAGGGGGAGGGAALAPIGSDVRRREPERASDNSLFYFNGPTAAATVEAARPDVEFAWRAPIVADRPAFASARDYLDEPHTLGLTGVGGVAAGGVPAYGAGLGSVWGGGWGTWGSGPLRPPPGFAPPSPPAQRSYDPFQSLASIWAPAPQEWRSAPAPDRDRDERT